MQVEPRAVRASFLLSVAVAHHPLIVLLTEPDTRLALAQKFIVDADVALGSATDHYQIFVRSEEINFPGGRPSKYLYFQSLQPIIIVILRVKVLWQVN